MTARKQWDEFRRIVKRQGKKYGGKFVAMVDRDIVAVGRDQYLLYKKVLKGIPPKKPFGIYYVPTKKDVSALRIV